MYALWLTAGILCSDLVLERKEFVYGVIITVYVISAAWMLHSNLPDAYRLDRGMVIALLVMYLIGSVAYGIVYYQYHLSSDDVETDNASCICGVIREYKMADDYSEYLVRVKLPSGTRKIIAKDYLHPEIIHEIGETVELCGNLKPPDVSRNPECFNYRSFLKSRGVTYVMNAEQISTVKLSVRPYDVAMNWIQEKKRRYAGQFDERTESFILGALFGDKSRIDDELYEEFAANGTAHILAVSGLHVGFLIALASAATRRRKGIAITASIVSVLILYGAITNWSASTVRAIIIATIAMLSLYIRKPFDLTSALSASLILTLVINPYQIYNSGYIMSYLAVFGIAFLTRPLSRYAGDGYGAIIAIQVATVPYTCITYNHINLLSVIINMPVVLIASFLIPIYIIGYIAYVCVDWCPEIYMYVTSMLTNLEIDVNRLVYMDGMPDMDICSRVVPVAVIYVLMFFITCEFCRVIVVRREMLLAGKILVLIMIPVLMYTYSIRNVFLDDEVVFVDVGQGDAVHLRAGDKDILFDGGGNINYNVGKKVLKPYLLKNQAPDIDMLFLTHLHMDHARGSTELAECYRIKKRVIPYFYEGSEETLQGDILTAAGDVYTISDDVSVEVLWPVRGSGRAFDTTDDNELNTIYKINYSGTEILITGDVLEQDELDMVEYYSGTDALKCDVLKVAHHGSTSSTSDAFLDAADPAIAVIQVGENNLYGHPAPQTVDKLTARGINVYRTDMNGAVGIDIRKDKIIVDKEIDNVI